MLKAVIFYCVNIGENDVLPSYLDGMPAKITDYYEMASRGAFHVQIVSTLKRDATHAIMGTIPFNDGNSSPYVASNNFMINVFTQADLLYDFGQFDNDGPDGIPNSGDDDGVVDFMFFWFLNYSARGTIGLEMNSDFTTQDVSYGPGHVPRGNIVISIALNRSTRCRKDLRDIVYGLGDYLGATFHEGGHALLNFPDMDHIGFTQYNHYSLGSYEVMSNGGYHGVSGFDGISSLYNPSFRELRGWLTPRMLDGDSTNMVLTDLDSTGLIYKYHPSSLPSEATPVNDFLITYHKKNAANYWTQNWPLGADGGVMVWHLAKSTVELYDANTYSDRRKMPIDIEAAHGKFNWVDTLNTGVQNALTGLDSIEIRQVSGNTVLWYPYQYGASKGVGSQSVYYVPNAGREFAFYSNPNSNYYRNSSSEEFAHSVTSGLSMKHLVRSSTTTVDFKVNDYSVTQNATMTAGTWYLKGNVDIVSGVTLSIDGATNMKFDPNLLMTVHGHLIIKNGANVNFVGSPTVTVASGGTIVVESSASLTISAGSQFRFTGNTGLVVNGRLTAIGTPAERVVFTSTNSTPTPGDWAGIVCNGGGPDTLNYCNIKYAQSGIMFISTNYNNSMQYDSVLSSLGDGVTVYKPDNMYNALRMYKCRIALNKGAGVNAGFGLVRISSCRVDSNGIGTVNHGIELSGGGALSIDSSNVVNNQGQGLIVSGTGSAGYLSPNGVLGGYNTFRENSSGEVRATGGGAAILGHTVAIIDHYDCPPGCDGGGIDQAGDVRVVSNIAPCDCTPVYRYEQWAGQNNFYNSQNFTGHFVKNENGGTQQARYNYWNAGSSSSGGFTGTVDTTYRLNAAVYTPSQTMFARIDHEEGFVPTGVSSGAQEIIDRIRSLRAEIVNNEPTAKDALRDLSFLAGPGKDYEGALGITWDQFLTGVEGAQKLVALRPLVRAHRLQAKLNGNDLSGASSLADLILQNNPNDGLWFFAVSRKLMAASAQGDLAGARAIYDNIRDRALTVDPVAYNLLGIHLSVQSQGDGASAGRNTEEIPAGVVGTIAPFVYVLKQNYPNPFNPVTRIGYFIPEEVKVSVRIFNTLGQQVANLIDDVQSSGYHEAVFDGTQLSSGIYFYKLQAGNYSAVKKLMLLK